MGLHVLLGFACVTRGYCPCSKCLASGCSLRSPADVSKNTRAYSRLVDKPCQWGGNYAQGVPRCARSWGICAPGYRDSPAPPCSREGWRTVVGLLPGLPLVIWLLSTLCIPPGVPACQCFAIRKSTPAADVCLSSEDEVNVLQGLTI